jgi:hypothetical protein
MQCPENRTRARTEGAIAALVDATDRYAAQPTVLAETYARFDALATHADVCVEGCGR